MYYESRTPDLYQTETGWIVERGNLQNFFQENLSEYGFNPNETNDFIHYWIPRLQRAEFYAIYPQTRPVLDKIIKLGFSHQPDSILRLFYVIKVANDDSMVPAPQIEPFERKGFAVAEWGVVLK
ncbi:hypothetical protein JW992_09025 [candidate division KSB1 bacterium]|nr:hypothetical protein [candidate division KSB1 bacterium]